MNIFPTLIILISLVAWHKLLWQAPGGEGYYYFDSGQDFVSHGRFTDLGQLDNFAKLTFDILPLLVNDFIPGYFIFQLIIMILLNLTIYFVVKFFVKNSLVSFTVAIFFAVSFIGSFEMLGSGNFQRLVQRVPNLIPQLFSFQQLAVYLQTRKIRNYFFSVLLFSLSILMGHFSTFLLPLFLVFPLVKYLEDFPKALNFETRLKLFLRIFIVSSSFVILNFVLISKDSLKPDLNLLEFISKAGIINISEKILLQFASLSIPPFIIEYISRVINPYKYSVLLLSIPWILIYIAGVILIKKFKPQFFSIYLTSVLVIPILLFLNLYLGKVDPLHNIRGYNYYFLPSNYPNSEIFSNALKGDRYYFVPMIFVSIIWTMLLSVLNLKKFKLNLVVIVTVFLLYIYSNISLIWVNMDRIQFNSNLMKNYLNFIKGKSEEFDNETIILSPRPLIWPAPFIRLFYGNPDIRFINSQSMWREEIGNINPKNIYYFDYDPKTWQILDLTREYREKLQN